MIQSDSISWFLEKGNIWHRTSCGIHQVFASVQGSQTSNVGSNSWINKQISINNKEHMRTVFLCSEAPSGTHLWLCKSLFIRINDSGIHLKTISPSSNWIFFFFWGGALFRRSTKNRERFPGTFLLFNNSISLLSYWYFASLTAHVCSIRTSVCQPYGSPF